MSVASDVSICSIPIPSVIAGDHQPMKKSVDHVCYATQTHDLPQPIVDLVHEIWEKASAKGATTTTSEELRRELLIILAHHPTTHHSNTWLPVALAIDSLVPDTPSAAPLPTLQLLLSTVSKHNNTTTTMVTLSPPSPPKNYLDSSCIAMACLIDSVSSTSSMPSYTSPLSSITSRVQVLPRGKLQRSASGSSTASTEAVKEDTEGLLLSPPSPCPPSPSPSPCRSSLTVPHPTRARRNSAPPSLICSERHKAAANSKSPVVLVRQQSPLLLVTPPSPVMQRWHTAPEGGEGTDDEMGWDGVKMQSIMSECSVFEVLPHLTVSLNHPLDDDNVTIVPHVCESAIGVTQLSFQVEGLEILEHSLKFSCTISDQYNNTLSKEGDILATLTSPIMDISSLFNGTITLCVTLCDSQTSKSVCCQCTKATEVGVVCKVLGGNVLGAKACERVELLLRGYFEKYSISFTDTQGKSIQTQATRQFTTTTNNNNNNTPIPPTTTTTPVNLHTLLDGGITCEVTTSLIPTCSLPNPPCLTCTTLLYKHNEPFPVSGVLGGKRGKRAREVAKVGGVARATPVPCLPAPVADSVWRGRDGTVRVKLIGRAPPGCTIQGVLYVHDKVFESKKPINHNTLVFSNVPLNSPARLVTWSERVRDGKLEKGQGEEWGVSAFHVVVGDVLLADRKSVV